MAQNVTITHQGFLDCQQVQKMVGDMQGTLSSLNKLVQNIPPSDWSGDAVDGLKSAVSDLQRITSGDFQTIHDKAQSGIDFYNTITDHDSRTGRQMRG